MITRIDLYQTCDDVVSGMTADQIDTLDVYKSTRRYTGCMAERIKAAFPQAIVAWQIVGSAEETCASIMGDDTLREITDARLCVDRIAELLHLTTSEWLVYKEAKS